MKYKMEHKGHQNFLCTMDLSLQHSAMMSIAAAVWKSPKIQAQLRTLMICYSLRKNEFEDNEEWERYLEVVGEEKCADYKETDYKEEHDKFFKNINEDLKLLNLPKVLIGDLLHVMFFLGLGIITWFENLYDEFQFFPFTCMRNIHVTCFGALDEAKTFDIESLKSDFLMTRKPDKILKDLEYYIACCCIQKNYLKQHGSEIIKTYNKEYNKWSTKHFILCSTLFLEGHKSVLRRIIRDMGLDCSIELYMVTLAVKYCSSDIAIRYYWKLLNNKEDLVEATLQVIKATIGTDSTLMYFKGWDCILLLLKQISDTEKQNFFFKLMEKKNILSELYKVPWPIESFFSPIFHIMKSNKAGCKVFYYRWLDSISNILHEYHNLGFDVKKTPQYKMFFIVFNEIQFCKDSSIRNSFELEYIRNFYSRPRHLTLVYNIFDVKMLDIKINFFYKEDWRRKAICAGNKNFKELIAADEYDKLNGFVESVLKSEGERKWFKDELLHFIPDFIMEDKFDVADKLLNWGCSSEEEKKLFKHKLDIMSICAKIYFKKDKLLSLKIFRWFFRKSKDKKEYFGNFAFQKFWGVEPKLPVPFLFVKCFREQYKEVETIKPLYLVHPEFELLNIIMAEGQNSFTDNLDEYLNWFFKTEEEVKEFKETILLNNCVFKNFVKNIFLFCRNHQSDVKLSKFCWCIEFMEKYLKFLTSSKNYESMKSQFFHDPEEWFVYLSQNFVGINQMDDFLDWILEKVQMNPPNKRSIIANFLLSSKGTDFFKNLVRQHHMFSSYKNGLVAWIKTLGSECKGEVFIDIPVIFSSLDDYHRKYCELNGEARDRSLGYIGRKRNPKHPPSHGKLCECNINLQSFQSIIHDLKNEINFKAVKYHYESLRVQRIQWGGFVRKYGPDFSIVKLCFSHSSVQK